MSVALDCTVQDLLISWISSAKLQPYFDEHWLWKNSRRYMYEDQHLKFTFSSQHKGFETKLMVGGMTDSLPKSASRLPFLSLQNVDISNLQWQWVSKTDLDQLYGNIKLHLHKSCHCVNLQIHFNGTNRKNSTIKKTTHGSELWKINSSRSSATILNSTFGSYTVSYTMST